MDMERVTGKKAENKGQGLIDLVFSWSLADALNKNLYMGKVGQIPRIFSSTADYMKSFIQPLIEETHADLLSALETVGRAPTREILDVKIAKGFKAPKDLYYQITLKRMLMETSNRTEGNYEPESKDLIALTDVKPRCPADLNRPKKPFLVALVARRTELEPDKLVILSSKPVVFDEEEDDTKKKKKKKGTLFAVYLTNMTTNVRIWTSLKSELEGGNTNIIKRVLQTDCNVGKHCTQCLSQGINGAPLSIALNTISSFKLDDSQRDAVLSCVATRECRHQNSVKLIWGPPGTGKTKTVSSLLVALLRLRCRTLTCAPTNIAVLGVASRLMSLVSQELKYDSYGFGDIVLFGNGERMKIDDHEDLYDVFLDYRVSVLKHCFAPLSGWKSSLESMICLLEDPEALHRLHLEKNKEEDEDDDDAEEEDEGNSKEKEGDDIHQLDRKEILRRAIAKNLKENKKKEKQNKQGTSQIGKSRGEKPKTQSTFEEFFLMRFKFIENQLGFCVTSLYTHMPTSLVSLELAKKMIRAFGLLKSIRTSLLRAEKNEDLRQANGIKSFITSSSASTECLQILKFLRDKLSLPTFTDHYLIQNFCLQNACLIFCTASSSAKLHTAGTKAPVELLVVDEAAQLKECESTIPLQLFGLRHAILIGDELQLPAMVQSKICEKSEFGRSLFERLVGLGHGKHLLNVQYRMHPSISLFPNREFYDRRILDGPNVKERTYEKRFLKGSMYGSYSFINVAQSKETQDSRHSTQNMVEVAVLAEIVANLYKESVASKQKVRVGCISPYKAQVFAIQEKLGKTYSSDANSNFSVSVRSVDGFQGGEEDLIIISTVRSNLKGSVGFLANRQRANVALTRARHCLWILGNGPTLVNSGTVWKKLVLDAQARGCFYDATDDKNLAKAVAGALIELNQFQALLRTDSPLFSNARWKVSFSDQFVESMTRITNAEVRKQVLFLLGDISSGWRQNQSDRIPNASGNISSQLLELRKVNGSLNLIWSVDVQRENSNEVQVLRVWDVLPSTEISRLVARLDNLFKNYTVETMNRCICRKLEGNLVVPLTWPAGSSSGSNSLTDYVRFLESRVASLSLKDKPRLSNN